MQSDSKMYGAADTEAQAPSQEKKAFGRKTIAAICLAAALSGAAAVSVARGRAGVANLYIKTVPLELDCRADCCCDCCGFTGDDCSGGIQGDICAFSAKTPARMHLHSSTKRAPRISANIARQKRARRTPARS